MKTKTKKQQAKQQIVALLVIAFMFVMISGSYDIQNLMAATGVNVSLQTNLTAGGLNVDSLTSLGFADIPIGSAQNRTNNLTVVNMQDYRGNGQGWTLSAYSNALTTSAGGTNTIANSFIYINTGAVGVVNGNATGVAASGSGSWRDLSSSRTLVNTATAANAGMGSYNLANTMVNVVYNGNPAQAAGTYQAQMTLTIVSN